MYLLSNLLLAMSSSVEPVFTVERTFQEVPLLIAQEIPAIQVAEFTFEYLECIQTPNTDKPLTCEFLVENDQEGERTLRIYAYHLDSVFSRIIDVEGNEIPASYVEIGNSSGNRYANADLPNEVPLKVSISFDEVPVNGIRFLDI
ncbi:MAG: hypothetical protein AAF193_08505, partial [Bacteroidota bacterium]